MLGGEDVERAVAETDLAAIVDRLEAFGREDGQEFSAGRLVRASRPRPA